MQCGGVGLAERVCWLADAPAGWVKVARGPGRGTLLRRLWKQLRPSRQEGQPLKPQPRGQSSPVCSVRRQLPGRRTSVFRPTDRGCEREPRQVRALPRGTPGWQVSGLPRTEWIGGSPDDVSEDPARRGCCARNVAPEGRDRVAVGFSQLKLSSSTTGNHCLHRILSGDRNLPADRSCPRAGVDFVPQASPQYGGLPILATTNKRRKQREISLAHSPIFQRVRPCWRFPWSAC